MRRREVAAPLAVAMLAATTMAAAGQNFPERPAAALGEAYRKLARNVFQPDDYYADSAPFAVNLQRDVEDKARLLRLLGEVK